VVVVVALSLKMLAQALSISRLYILGGSWAENAVFRKKWEKRGIGAKTSQGDLIEKLGKRRWGPAI
jgi:hypothetical protein